MHCPFCFRSVGLARHPIQEAAGRNPPKLDEVFALLLTARDLCPLEKYLFPCGDSWCTCEFKFDLYNYLLHNQTHRTPIVARVTKGPGWALGKRVASKNSRKYSTSSSYPQLDTPRCARYASGEAHLGSAECFYSGDLNATREGQFCHKLVAIRNWNMTSLTGEEHELVVEAKRYTLDMVSISSSKHRGSYTAELDDVWKPFCTGTEPAKFGQVGAGIPSALSWLVVLLKWNPLWGCTWWGWSYKNAPCVWYRYTA